MPKGVYERQSPVGPATRGKRVDIAQAPPSETGNSEAEHVYVCTARPLKVGAYILREGVEVPGAHGWLRLESWVNARRVRRIKVDDQHTSWDDFVAGEQAKEE